LHINTMDGFPEFMDAALKDNAVWVKQDLLNAFKGQSMDGYNLKISSNQFFKYINLWASKRGIRVKTVTNHERKNCYEFTEI